jgi:hypothetical protein
VCARYLPLVTKDKGATLPAALDPSHKPWHEVPAADIPGKEVLVTAEHLGLDAAGHAIPLHTAELPRAGLTRFTIAGVSYCLEPAGIVQANGEHIDMDSTLCGAVQLGAASVDAGSPACVQLQEHTSR